MEITYSRLLVVFSATSFILEGRRFHRDALRVVSLHETARSSAANSNSMFVLAGGLVVPNFLNSEQIYHSSAAAVLAATSRQESLFVVYHFDSSLSLKN